MRTTTFLLVCVLPQLAFVPSVRGQLVQVREDFSRDPGWDHYQNRIVGTDMPQVDPGLRLASHELHRRRSGRDRRAGRELAASGLLRDAAGQAPDLRRRVLRLRQAGPAPHRPAGGGLRRLLQLPAAHLARLDLDGLPRLGGGRPGPGHVRLDVEPTGRPAAPRPPSCSSRTASRTPGASATSPRRRADPVWHDEALERHITDRTGNGQPYELQGEEHLFERLKKEEPGLTREAAPRTAAEGPRPGPRRVLPPARDAPLVEAPDAGKGHGRVTLRFDGETPVRHLVRRGDPAVPGRVRPLRPVQHRPVRHAGGDVPRRPDGQRPEARPVAGPALGGAQQRVALHRAELPRRCTATAGRRRTGPARSPARSAACSGGPSRPTRSAPTTATTWAS